MAGKKKSKASKKLAVKLPDTQEMEKIRVMMGVNALLVINKSFTDKRKIGKGAHIYRVFIYRSTESKLNNFAFLILENKLTGAFLVPADYDFVAVKDLDKYLIVSDPNFADPGFLLDIATKISSCTGDKSVMVPFSDNSFSSIGYRVADSSSGKNTGSPGWLQRVMSLVGK